MTGLERWMTERGMMRAALRYQETREVPASEEWRLDYLRKLLCQRQVAYYDGNDDNLQQLSILINSLVINRKVAILFYI